MTGADQQPTAAAAIQTGSASFAMASRLLAPATRVHVWRLYAWCRHCDDVTDGQVMGHRDPATDRFASVETVRDRSVQALDGRGPVGEPYDGLARVVHETDLPRRYVIDHLRGFELDAAGYHCDTLTDTLSYAYHVAGVVGLMMAWMMGIRDRATMQRACDLGMAFQLTNIARDVSDDAMSGRVYLPADWLRRSGITLDPGRPLNASTREALVPPVNRLLDEADRYYGSAWYGIGQLPPRSAWAVATARHVYADIGDEVRRRGAAAWDQRVATTRRRKVRRVIQAFGETAWTRASRHLAAPSRDGLWTPPLVSGQG